MTQQARPATILRPFTKETARQKVQLAEDAWNTRDPDRVALAYTDDSQWRNRDEFLEAAPRSEPFLSASGSARSTTGCGRSSGASPTIGSPFGSNTKSRDVHGQWWRSHGNEHWEFDEESGLMRRRDASINDHPIEPSEHRIALDDAHPRAAQ